MTTTTFNAPAASLFGSLRQAFSALIGAAPKAALDSWIKEAI